jgi:hypothetical protein
LHIIIGFEHKRRRLSQGGETVTKSSYKAVLNPLRWVEGIEDEGMDCEVRLPRFKSWLLLIAMACLTFLSVS